jgi:hypothetical protein
MAQALLCYGIVWYSQHAHAGSAYYMHCTALGVAYYTYTYTYTATYTVMLWIYGAVSTSAQGRLILSYHLI